VLALAAAAFFYYKYYYVRRRTAAVLPNDPASLQDPLLADENAQEPRVTTPVMPADLDFGDDGTGRVDDAAAAAAGWSTCYSCQAPVSCTLLILHPP